MEALKQRNYNRWKVEALGEFVSLDKLVFTNWKVEEFNHEEIQGQLLCGLDFGFVNDISAFVASILDEKNKRIYIFKEWGDTGKTNKELVNIITSLGFSKSVIMADAAEPKSIAEMKTSGIGRIRACKKGPDSILHGIQQLQNYELVVHPSCEGIRCELENYSWTKDKKTGEYINKPIDSFNHYLDALRYSLQCIATRLKTLDKNLF
jgi:phage terminase large subunit